MFIQVKLLRGLKDPLLYQAPDEWPTKNLVGTIVHVPLRNRVEVGIVTEQYAERPDQITFTIKEAFSIEAFPDDQHYQSFIKQLSNYYCVDPIHFIKRTRQFIAQKNTKERTRHEKKKENVACKAITLTDEQKTVYTFLAKNIITPAYTPTLLHGVTGSGKTEVYKKLITTAMAQNKSVILLLPEVTLATQFERLLHQELPSSITLHGFHSATSPREKRQLWKNVLNKKPIVIVGVHLPVLLPIANLGLIIIDEEHETGYQEKKHPKINSKEAALIRAKLCNIPILLGSATPSFSSLYNVSIKRWHFFQLKKRFSGSFPTIKTVFLTENKNRKNFWITKELHNAITDRLQKKEQTIIFINRRGFSFFVQCKECEFIFQCTSCSVSLTLHKNNILTCHYCSYSRSLPPQCPKCKADEKKFLKKGIGTQQVVTILQKLFPHARVERADMDTTTNKKKWQQTIADFSEQKIDILVGTQTITKGYHFPNVTLVGIIWADLNIHLPFYNAAETALQQLIQVAGRAGRQKEGSLVIAQSMGDHPIFNYLNEVDYLNFYKQEIASRKEVRYPPYVRFIEIEIKNTDETTIENESQDITFFLFDQAKKYPNTMILGPSKPPVHTIKKTHARKIYIKTDNIKTAIVLFQSINFLCYKSSIFFTPNPGQ